MNKLTFADVTASARARSAAAPTRRARPGAAARRPRQSRWPVPALLMAGLTGAIVAAQAGSATAMGATAPSGPAAALLLQPSDVPAGFTAAAGLVISRAQAAEAAHVGATTLQREGWRAAAEVTYQRATPNVGLAMVDETLSVFQGTAGAHWYILSATRQADRTARGALPARRLALGPIGAERAGWLVTRGTMSGATILFRHGRYVVTLTGAGLTRTFSPAQIVTLAQRQDRRLDRASAG